MDGGLVDFADKMVLCSFASTYCWVYNRKYKGATQEKFNSNSKAW